MRIASLGPADGRKFRHKNCLRMARAEVFLADFPPWEMLSGLKPSLMNPKHLWRRNGVGNRKTIEPIRGMIFTNQEVREERLQEALAELGGEDCLPEDLGGGMARRNFLKASLLLVAGGIFASVSDAAAFLSPQFTSRSGAVSTVAIPEEWVRRLGPQVRDYVRYLQSLRLRNIRIHQIIEPHLRQRGSVSNTLPPKPLWRNIRNTLRATDLVAQRLGEPVKDIVSAYRSPAYNARCPGARSNSYHMQNMALDLQFRSSPRRVAMVARELRERGIFSGGVGRYGSFTHLDTRGKKADW